MNTVNVNYELLNVAVIMTMMTFDMMFYYFIFKFSTLEQKESAYYFRLYFIITALGFAFMIVSQQLPESLTIFVTTSLYIIGVFAIRQGVLIRNGLTPVLLKHNKWLYADIIILSLLINVVIFHFIHKNFLVPLFLSSLNMSAVILSIPLFGFKHKKQLNSTDKFLIGIAVTIATINMFLPVIMYVLKDIERYYFTTLFFIQVVLVFLWTVSLAIVLLLDLLEWHFYKSVTDNLTQLFNRGYFNEHVAKQLKSSHNTSSALLFLDIDFFKKVNDTYGHNAGDLVIQTVSNVIQEHVTEIDTDSIVSRFGGEEFAVFFKEISVEEANATAERLRKTVESLYVEYNDQIMQITISIGLRMVQAGSSLEDELKIADKALYEAKENGRNRICLA